MYSITLGHGLFLMVIMHVARCAYVTQRTLQNSGQFMRSLEVSATDNHRVASTPELATSFIDYKQVAGMTTVRKS